MEQESRKQIRQIMKSEQILDTRVFTEYNRISVRYGCANASYRIAKQLEKAFPKHRVTRHNYSYSSKTLGFMCMWRVTIYFNPDELGMIFRYRSVRTGKERIERDFRG
jgi:hypothetical protein